MAKDKNVLDRDYVLSVYDTMIRSNGDEIPVESSRKLFNLAFSIYDEDDFETEKESYDGSLGNFFVKK